MHRQMWHRVRCEIGALGRGEKRLYLKRRGLFTGNATGEIRTGGNSASIGRFEIAEKLLQQQQQQQTQDIHPQQVADLDTTYKYASAFTKKR